MKSMKINQTIVQLRLTVTAANDPAEVFRAGGHLPLVVTHTLFLSSPRLQQEKWMFGASESWSSTSWVISNTSVPDVLAEPTGSREDLITKTPHRRYSVREAHLNLDANINHFFRVSNVL
ncbi:uncharacterized protein NCU17281 [Neurospora crassa OR74A]|uniref:Uncharacterized protein n=1 Tax=Neurospora crassa (strain ATCC 24698 / 74-OR23-1A / CBS 708.71 / DSM 1257 / FGSC 987) TaxID=367110 RepID=V5IKJ5_NEUCR|nr:uncharacterized protein NCU17281 [Neurospora crassa OR74A]ESA42073.1 hypothetical protein, variant [Neurospora crassa OR74A]|eukprot:XP_011395399.1 uncharacterized protein NCU17281 [Neurospora crassa OR74A]